MSPAVLVLGGLGGLAVLAFRWFEGQRPITVKSLLAPPLGMSTGLMMFAWPSTQIPWSWGLLGCLTGALLLALPLIYTSPLEARNGRIYLRRSPVFFLVLLLLIALRLGLRHWLEQYLSWPQAAGLFYLVALGMMWRWRLALFLRFRELSG